MGNPLRSKIFVVLCALFLSTTILQAQNEGRDVRITQTFENQSLADILKYIETQSGRTFHVDGGEYLNTLMNRTFNNATIEEALEDLFQGSTHGYLIYRDYAVLVLPRTLLDQEFSSEYYQVLNQTTNTADGARNKNIVIGKPRFRGLLKTRITMSLLLVLQSI